jgi:NAD(P)-dependent dehydrogenase (short-subunit alcohol dehydrogenase family)
MPDRTDLNGKVILVTGATDGLGRGLARELAGAGANVILHGRDQQRTEATRREIEAATGSRRLSSLLADLSSLAEVRRLAGEVSTHHDRLDGLVNNAGVGSGPRDGTRRELSQDGYELRFAVNYLAPFLLTHLLLPLLERSAPARIVNVASVGQQEIDFDDVMLERGYTGTRAYRQSKLALIAFTFDLAERLDPAAVTANALHPASLMPTKMVDESFGYTMSTLEEGVEAALRLLADPRLEGVSGRYFDQLSESKAQPQAYDPGARERLRRLSVELTGLAVAS